MKIKLLKHAATILAEQYEFHASDKVFEAVIDTEANNIEFRYSTTEYGTNGKHYTKIKHDDALVVADAAYYKSATFADKVI